MDKLQELIKDGGWRPIEEAPKDGVEVLLAQVGKDYRVGYGVWNNGIWTGLSYEANPTHFMPLDTPERMAKVIQVLVNGLETVVVTGDKVSMVKTAKKSIQEANKIAGGE